MVMHSRLLAAPSGEETAGSSRAGFILSLVPRQVRRLFIPPGKTSSFGFIRVASRYSGSESPPPQPLILYNMSNRLQAATGL